MIQCRLCNLQYIGETKRRLKDRFSEHRRPVLNPPPGGGYSHIHAIWVCAAVKQAVCVTRFDQSERVICVGIFALGKSRFEKCMR